MNQQISKITLIANTNEHTRYNVGYVKRVKNFGVSYVLWMGKSVLPATRSLTPEIVMSVGPIHTIRIYKISNFFSFDKKSKQTAN